MTRSATSAVLVSLCAILSIAASPARASEAGEPGALGEASTTLTLNASDIRWSDAAPDPDATLGKPAPLPYGEPGPWWISLGIGLAPAQTEGDFAVDARLNLTTSTFLVEDIEFLMEWDLWGFLQEGTDSVGLSWSFLLRVHFPLDEQKDTTFFLDGGVGVLGSVNRVPEDGTYINFIPKLGVGISHRLDDSASRLVGGVRWHHISNARINGEDRNPSRDGVMVYLGYTFPL